MRLRALAIAGAVVTAIAMTGPAATARPAAAAATTEATTAQAVGQRAASTAAATATTPTISLGSSTVIDDQPPHASGETVSGLACATASLCFATGEIGQLAVTSNADAATPAWVDEPAPWGGTLGDASVACPSSTLCVLLDSNRVAATTDPSDPTSWKTSTHSTAVYIRNLSCTTDLCFAATEGSTVERTTDPADPTSWAALTTPLTAPYAASCASDTFCAVAGIVRANGTTTETFAFTTDPRDATPSWTTSTLPAEAVGGLSCASASACLASTGNGLVSYSADASDPSPTWTSTRIITNNSNGYTDLACVGTGPCEARFDGTVAEAPSMSSTTWTSTTVNAPFGNLLGLECRATGCAYGDQSGKVWFPASSGTPVETDAVGTSAITALDCPSTSLCVAGDAAGTMLTWPGPSHPTVTSRSTGGGTAVTAVSCLGTALCVGAHDANTYAEMAELLVSTDPGDTTPTWKRESTSLDGDITGVACATTRACYLTTRYGAVTAPEPGGGEEKIDPTTGQGVDDGSSGFTGVSCGSASLCVLTSVDRRVTGGDATYEHGAGGTPFTNAFVALSCPSAATCVGELTDGRVVATDDPVEPLDWKVVTSTPPIGSNPLYAAPSLVCARDARVCLDLYQEQVSATSDLAAWSAPITGADVVSCDVVAACAYATGDAVGALTVTPGTATQPTAIAVEGAHANYLGDGPPAAARFAPLTALAPDGLPAYATSTEPQPAIAAEPEGAWPAAAIVVHGGTSQTDGYGVAVHTAYRGWSAIAGGSCLGVGATATATTLYVACEGTDHGYYTATTALPLTGSSRLTAWVHHAGTLTGAPALAVIGGQVEVAVIGVRGVLYTQVLGQPGFSQLPASCAAAPALAGYGATGVLACHAGSGPLVVSTFSGGRFGGFANLGGAVVGQPGVALGANGPTYAVEGTTQQVYTRTASTGWATRGGKVTGGAAIAQL